MKTMEVFTEEEQLIIIEAAKVSLGDSMVYEMIADEMDLSDEVLANLRDKIHIVMNTEAAICKHCNQPISLKDGEWVHDDVDEDPTAEDYGWAKCSGEITVAEPSTE